MRSETIAAVSTAPGEAAIAVIRISGPDSHSIGHKLVPGVPGQPRNRHMYWGKIIDHSDGKMVDEVMAAFFKGPGTYTGEDMVEIYTHGGLLIVRKVLQLVISVGARLAIQGEFTRRALINGQMDLTQAEAVIGLIRARSESAVKAAAGQLAGDTGQELVKLSDRITDLLAEAEATIDFPDESIRTLDKQKFKKEAKELIEEVKRLNKRIVKGSEALDGVKVVIVGPPNAGKSTLLNCLLDQDRAIVSELPGTTRDVIEGQIIINGTLFTLADTAGLGFTDDSLAEKTRQKALRYLEEANIVLGVFDGSRTLDNQELNFLEYLNDKKVLKVVNKSDLPNKIDDGALGNLIPGAHLKGVSALKGQGIDELKEEIFALYSDFGATQCGDALFVSLEHAAILNEVESALVEMNAGIDEGKITEELVAEYFKRALVSVNMFLGNDVSEQVLDRIFSRFCIGK